MFIFGTPAGTTSHVRGIARLCPVMLRLCADALRPSRWPEHVHGVVGRQPVRRCQVVRGVPANPRSGLRRSLHGGLRRPSRGSKSMDRFPSLHDLRCLAGLDGSRRISNMQYVPAQLHDQPMVPYHAPTLTKSAGFLSPSSAEQFIAHLQRLGTARVESTSLRSRTPRVRVAVCAWLRGV